MKLILQPYSLLEEEVKGFLYIPWNFSSCACKYKGTVDFCSLDIWEELDSRYLSEPEA